MLNPQQKLAVQTTEGRLLVLAGAGSGKTSVLSFRIAHLINTLQIEPSQILALTFTNKAAQEMKHRLSLIIPSQKAKKINVGTFHSFCLQILKEEIHRLGYANNFTLYTEQEVKRVANQIARILLSIEGDLPSLQSTLEKIALTRCEGLSLMEIEAKANTWHDQFTLDLLKKLQICLRAHNAVDFDTLLCLTVELFEQHQDVLSKYQEQFRYIMIDEYQDTNPIQYKIAEFLSGKHGNLCVVGDDDQSIYSWRGAKVKHILEFQNEKQIKLEQNYRSTSIILEASNALIKNNKERHDKQLWSTQTSGPLISLFHAPSEKEEAIAIAQRIAHLKTTQNLKWKDFAVLYRSNILSKSIEEALIETSWNDNNRWIKGIPYEIFGGTELYERSEIKDLLAYLRLISNPMDQEALLRIINIPRRGLAETTLDKLTQLNRKLDIPLWSILKEIKDNSLTSNHSHELNLSNKTKTQIGEFVKLIENFRQKFSTTSLKTSLIELIEVIKYKEAIKEDVKSEKMRSFKWENVQFLISCVENYENASNQDNLSPSLDTFLSSSYLNENNFFSSSEEVDKVHLMTFHSSKGLEFNTCFLIGLEDHIIPHEKSLKEGDVEEERRLMYVGMTRAKKKLFLSMSRQRKKMGQMNSSNPSRFIFEIPPHLVQIVSWQHLD